MASKHLWATKLTADDSTAKEQLGSVRKEWNTTDSCFKVYKYVQASLTSAASNGIPLLWYDTLGTVATDDISTTKQGQPAGVAIGTLTTTQYGWIQIGGYHSAVATDGGDDISDGDSIIYDTTDRKVDSVAAGTAPTHKIMGVAVADDVNASDTVAVLLDCTYGDII